MSHAIHCDICDHSQEWIWTEIKNGWKKVQPLTAVAFQPFPPETHVCPQCWQLLLDHKARITKGAPS